MRGLDPEVATTTAGLQPPLVAFKDGAGRGTTRWLKAKAGLLVPALSWTVGDSTSTSTSTTGSLQLVASFWQRGWDRHVLADHEERLENLWNRCPPPQAAWPGDQGPLCAAELMHRARAHAKSSAGPDGISPQCLADMPLKFWVLFAERLAHWCERDTFPAAWREARMGLLPKDISDGTQIEVSRLRPITVFNAAYRVVVGTWTSRSCVQGWLPEVCPDCFHGGIRGRNAWQALRHLEAAWDDNSVLVSFDSEKCFDRVSPRLALGNLERHGCPADLLKVVRWTWLEQRRWIQLGRFVHPEVQRVSESLPQGCPASSMALIALLLGPVATLQGHMGDALCQSIFLDDTAALVRTVEAVEEVIDFWAQAAGAMGLEENAAKLKVVTRCGRLRQQLLDRGVDTSLEATVLGTAFREELLPTPTRSMMPPKSSQEVLSFPEGDRLDLGRLCQAPHAASSEGDDSH